MLTRMSFNFQGYYTNAIFGAYDDIAGNQIVYCRKDGAVKSPF